jgi:Tol biopolymer transport system component
MTLSAGTRLGSYEITVKLGEGGMGQVYRATDTRLRRDVAIKVLPEAFTRDGERLARFEREAQVLAQLHHPNISSIFGLEEAGGSRALVMELVEGPTLAERIAQGPIPVDESLAIARQIAEALEEAHDKGIVHRDLKPANVKLTPGGVVKVLDFGLAKALDPGGTAPTSSAQVSLSPTLTHAATQMGMILGTAAYMAPEQAAGSAVDRRADIWSFGVVLFEMLTGRRLFDGETVSHVLASVLKDTPDFGSLPKETPARIADLLRRCLRKKPRERLQAIGDARLAIDEALSDPRGSEPAPAVAQPSRIGWVAGAAGLLAAAVFAVLWLSSGTDTTSPRALHAALVAPPGTAFGDTFALSPDGRSLVFEAYEPKSGARSLWLRSLDRGEAARLPAADGGEMPFWSPDGAHIGFFADGRLKRLDPAGGPAQVLCDAPTPRGGAWGADGRIVFAGSFRAGLSVVSATGGVPEPLTTLDAARGEKSHRFPLFLPGGKTILFLAQSAEGGTRDDASGIEALELSSGKRTRLIGANASPLYAPEGLVLFWRDGSLLAQRFDAGALALSGDPIAIAGPVAYTQNEQILASVSADGTLVYREGSRGTYSSLVWLDREGGGLRNVRDRELVADDFAISGDGKRLAYAVNSEGQGATDLWLQELPDGTPSRFTFEAGGDRNPVWSSDDRFLYYINDRRNDGVVYRRRTDGTGAAEEVGTTDSGIWPLAASHDGLWLVVGAVGAQTAQDLLRFDLATKQLTPLVASSSIDDDAALSPDDRFLAFASEQSGRYEIYVQSLSGSGKWQISSEGGRNPRWRRDGRELYYLARPDRVMAVDVEPGEIPRFSAPRELFRQPIERFEVSADGREFIALRTADSDVNKPLTLVSGWTQRRR